MTTPRSRRSVSTAWTRGAIGVFALFLCAEALTRAEFVTPSYLPPASSIIGETVGLFGDGDFWDALGSTMWATLLGMLRALLIAIPLGILLGLSKWAYRASITVVELLRPIPSVALIPLATLVYGRGTSMKVFVITYACVWPLLFNTIYGMRSVDPVAVDTARSFGLGKFKTALRVNLPAAAPFIFTGIKIASAVALILAISAEIVGGGSSGLGIEMLEARAVSDLQRTYAYTLISGLIGLILYVVFEFIESRVFGWNASTEVDS